MDIEEYINRSDILTYFEDVMYSDYFTWFVHMPYICRHYNLNFG